MEDINSAFTFAASHVNEHFESLHNVRNQENMGKKRKKQYASEENYTNEHKIPNGQ
jgi:hypothetical protein